jgi:hypothetical protein
MPRAASTARSILGEGIRGLHGEARTVEGGVEGHVARGDGARRGIHVVFGKTVPDVSLNALANLGYAEGGFHRPVYPGETLSTSEDCTAKRGP